MAKNECAHCAHIGAWGKCRKGRNDSVANGCDEFEPVPLPTSRPIDTALHLRAQLDQEREESGHPWPAWLGDARHRLIDWEQMAALGQDAGDERVASLARLLGHDLRELRDWLDASERAAAELERAAREVGR